MHLVRSGAISLWSTKDIVDGDRPLWWIMKKLLRFDHKYYYSFIFCWAFLIGFSAWSAAGNNIGRVIDVDVGVILDLGSLDGVVLNSSISMAVEDFYKTTGRDYRTRLILHDRDSRNSSVVEAASAALQLIKTVGVRCIILGPQTSEEADPFLARVGTEARVPVVSFSAAVDSPARTPYFVRISANQDSIEARPIAAILKAFNWKDVTLIHDDTHRGNALILHLTDAIQLEASLISRTIALPSTAVDEDSIRQAIFSRGHLNNITTALPAGVYVVHLPVSIGGAFFRLVNEAGMMVDGYVWIVTSRLANLVKSMDPSSQASMEGVIGIKTYVPKSRRLDNFRSRFKQKLQKEHYNYPDDDVYALWAYDATWATALAAEKAAYFSDEVSAHNFPSNSTESKLLQALLATRFHGLSGEISLSSRSPFNSTFEIINVEGDDGGEIRRVGYWTPGHGLSRSLAIFSSSSNSDKNKTSSISTKRKLHGRTLAAIIWPGGSTQVPKLSPIAAAAAARNDEMVLRVGVPAKTAYKEFVKVEWDPEKRRNVTKGYSIDIFLRLMDAMPYKVRPDFQPYDNGHVDELGYYDELIYQVYKKRYDAVVGDTTIIANRSNYVDFSQPYVDSGISMIVPIVDADITKKFWWFLAPLSAELWLATIGMSLFKGILVWFFEHYSSTNKEFQGTKFAEQVGKILYSSFTFFVFANREELKTNYARVISGLWTFVVFVLVTSYCANLTSILTVEKLRPKVTELQTLIKNKENIGCQNGSFVVDFLKEQGVGESNIKAYASVEEYAEALNLGTPKGGVSAIVDEIPYIRVFLKYYCRNYTMAGKTYRTGGFGFAFARGSALVSDVSRAILQFDQDQMNRIENKWFGNTTCPDPLDPTNINYELSLSSFHFIYLTTISVSGATVVLFFIKMLFKKRKGARIGGAPAVVNPVERPPAVEYPESDDEVSGSSSTTTQYNSVDAGAMNIEDSGNDIQAGPSSPAGSASHCRRVVSL